nr:large conductance mechanosensitive channel protein MscL [Bacteroidota bacterium]
MGFVKEFKEFAIKGNLVDMAIGVVMGAAFGKVVSAFIDGMVMPLIGMLTSGQDFSKLAYVMQAEVKDAAGVVTTHWLLKVRFVYQRNHQLLVVALVVFMVIKAMNNMKKAEAAAAPPPPPASEVLLSEIRDLLKK